jgi:predicted ATPase
LLTGGPGTGKSMILAWLAGLGPLPEDTIAQTQLARVRSQVKAAHFCQAGSRNVNPQAFAKSIANQLTHSVRGFADALSESLAELSRITAVGVSITHMDFGTLGDELAFDRAFTVPLKRLYDSGYTEPMLLLVDALDQAPTLPDLLSRLTDLPCGIRILAATREEPRVLKFFRQIKPVRLVSHAPQDIDESRVYVGQLHTSVGPIREAKRTAVSLQVPERVANTIDQFTGRTWLLPKILEWWDQSNERLFLLTGGPGTDKSMIVAWLAGFGPLPQDAIAQTQLARVRSLVRAAYFCQACSRNVDPQAFSESIANQLTESVKGFSQAFTVTRKRLNVTATITVTGTAPGATVRGISIGRLDLSGSGDEFSFDWFFVQPLKTLYGSGYRESMLLLIDALDEAEVYTGITLTSLLSRLADLPVRVRILATTRHARKALKLFPHIPPFDLIRNAPTGLDDVRAYASQRLPSGKAIRDANVSAFADRLSTQAGGVFLYAAMVLDELLEKAAAELPGLDGYPLPEGLSVLYHTFLDRDLGRDEQRWLELFRPLPGVISVAQGEGLTASQLANIVKRDTLDVAPALRQCSQYLSGELPEGRICCKRAPELLVG